MMSSVYLIVTVTVGRPCIMVLVIMAVLIQMMNLNQRLGHEDESAGFAFSFLHLQ